jgi:hypothetical protein
VWASCQSPCRFPAISCSGWSRNGDSAQIQCHNEGFRGCQIQQQQPEPVTESKGADPDASQLSGFIYEAYDTSQLPRQQTKMLLYEDRRCCRGCGLVGVVRSEFWLCPCVYCKKTGHVVSECPTVPPCPYCRKKGHKKGHKKDCCPDETPLKCLGKARLKCSDNAPLKCPDEVPLECPDEAPLKRPDEAPLKRPNKARLEMTKSLNARVCNVKIHSP